jgi:hypothetical protein
MVISKLCSDTGDAIVGHNKKSVVRLLASCSHKVVKMQYRKRQAYRAIKNEVFCHDYGDHTLVLWPHRFLPGIAIVARGSVLSRRRGRRL